jgi:hypothetical protein
METRIDERHRFFLGNICCLSLFFFVVAVSQIEGLNLAPEKTKTKRGERESESETDE